MSDHQVTSSSRNKQWLMLSVVIVGLFLISLFFLVGRSDDTRALTARIAVSKTPLSAPVFIAHEKGFFDEHCGRVELVEVIGGNKSFDTMASGDADYATSSDSVIVYRAFRRSDFSVLASFVQSDNDIKFIVPESSSKLGAVASMKGKKVGVVRGTASEYFLSTVMAYSGLSLDDIELVDSAVANMPELLKSGQVDAVAPWEPYAYKTMQALEGKGNVVPTKNLYTLSFNLLAMKNTVDNQPETTECVLSALNDAIDYISGNPVATQKIIRERLGLENGFVMWMWPDYLFKLTLNKSLLLTLNNQAEWLVSSGAVPDQSVPQFERFLDAVPLSAVKPELVLLDKRSLHLN